MTLFEYLAIAFGLLYSVAALRLIGGLSVVLDRDRSYWVHTTLVVALLLGIAGAFWATWSLAEIQWTFPRFLIGLGMPGTVYFNAATLVPADPHGVVSWREHYYRVRRRFFAGLSAWAVVAAVNTSVNLAAPVSHPSRIIQAMVFIAGLAGASSPNPRLHGALALGIVALVFIAATIVGASPGWLADG